MSVITGSYVVTYLGRDDLNLKIPLIIQLTLGSWSKVFPPILGNMANNPLYGEDGLKMTLPPNKWKYMGLEFCLDL